MRPPRIKVSIAAATALLALALTQAPAATPGEPDRVCGTPPGDGAYSYTRAWDVTCKRARKVSRRAGKKFCGERFQTCNADPGEFDRGRVRVKRWRCKMRVGYEFYRAACEKGDRRFIAKSAA